MRSINYLAVALFVVLGLMFVNHRVAEADGGPPSVILNSATGKGTITLTTNHPSECAFENVAYGAGSAAFSNPGRSLRPAIPSNPTQTLLESQLPEQDQDYDYPFGLVQFTLYCPALGVTAAQAAPMTVDVTMTFSDSSDMSAYTLRKYGPTPGNASPHWYSFVWDGTTGVVSTSGNSITLRYVDAQRGDDITTVQDESIVDQIGPGVTVSHAVPAVNVWGLLVFMLCAGLAGVYFLLRSRRRA